MSDSDLNVLHVVARDTPPARLETLRALLARGGLVQQRVVQLGGGRIATAGLGRVERLIAPLGVDWLTGRRLRRVILPAARTVTHIWSPGALRSLLPVVTRQGHISAPEGGVSYRLLVDAEAPLDARRLVSGLKRLSPEAQLGFVCPSDTGRRRLLEAGLPAERCVVIRDSVDSAAIEEASRSDVRSQLELSPEQTAILILPPVLRETGAFTAAWAVMLLAQVREDVRLIVPNDGREVRRVAHLVESCRHGWLLRLPGRRLELDALTAAADLAIYLPPGGAPLSSVARAMAAGCPLVASGVAVLTELLAHGRNAWLCRADDPKDAARWLLRAVENREQSRQQAERARSQARELFGRHRMVGQYARVYENLLADRRLDDGLDARALDR